MKKLTPKIMRMAAAIYGAQGGRSRSPAKRAAGKINAAKALQQRLINLAARKSVAATKPSDTVEEIK